MSDNKGDQSTIAGLVYRTDQVNDRTDPQIRETDTRILTGSNARAEDILARRVDDAFKAVDAGSAVEADFEAMGGESITVAPADTEEYRTVHGDLDPSAEKCGNKLRAGLNAADMCDDMLERTIVDFVKQHFELSYDRIKERYDHWKEAEVAHDVYVPAQVVEQSRGRSTTQKPMLIDIIKTPYSRAITDTISVFDLAVFGGSPPFKLEVTGTGSTKKAAKILEAELHKQLRLDGYEAKFYQTSLDTNRYGMAATLVQYDQNGGGNKLVNLDPWCVFPDPRVTAQDRNDGDFVGYRSWASKTRLMRRSQVYANLHKLSDTQPSVSWQANTPVRDVIRGQSVDMANDLTRMEAGTRFSLGTAHVLNTLWVWMDPAQLGIPAEFGLYKIVIADEKTVVSFHRTPYSHGKLPILFCDGYYDAHKTFNSGAYDLMIPLQRFQDWLLRARVENIQSMVQNRLVADPAKINIRDILDPDGTRLIRALPGADVNQGIRPLEVPDATRGYWADLQAAGDLMQRVSSANDTAQGVQSDVQRTATEISRLTSMGQQRLGMYARLKSATFMRSKCRVMVSNIQQFGMDGGVVPEGYLRDTGLQADAQSGTMQWSSGDIVGQYDYKVVDGTLPIDPANNTENLIRALRAVGDVGLGSPNTAAKFLPRIIESMGFSDVEEWGLSEEQLVKGFQQAQQMQNQVVADEQIRQQLQDGDIVPASRAAQEMGIEVPGTGTVEQPEVRQ